MNASNCQISNCSNRSKSKSKLCSTHLERKRLHGDTRADVPLKKLEVHSMSHSREYKSWDHARQRVTNPNNDMYYRYGGRGITMCKEWLESFTKFYEDMGNRPEGTSLDRIDTNGSYEPSNCRWATRFEQAINTNVKSTNTTGYKGIAVSKVGTWGVRIGYKNRMYNLGTYKTLDEALKVRKQAEMKYWGVAV